MYTRTSPTTRQRLAWTPALFAALSLVFVPGGTAFAQPEEPSVPEDALQPDDLLPPDDDLLRPDDDLLQPKDPGDENPELAISVEPQCEPEAGVGYEIDGEGVPPGPHIYRADWQELPAGSSGSEHGKSGLISTGEGEFEVRGVATGVLDGSGTYETEWQVVTVDCTDEDDGKDDEGEDDGEDDGKDDGGEDGGGEDDGKDEEDSGSSGSGGSRDIVEAEPNFTG
ncbi:hypothetical protein H0B56_08090 [Haloechinothrix sp. YIM 98757]|uniref:Uncharacterized protein n=1 Tax=Haloechinothrix aidingensis TaxID=2752311 RepID=A0A838A867_9PSEU|nr:hypothetical protein [Haloechinothrix aidingensis]MBA0125498.1 hypothetical protein [Haloechinothrix aidingensis]